MMLWLPAFAASVKVEVQFMQAAHAAAFALDLEANRALRQAYLYRLLPCHTIHALGDTAWYDKLKRQALELTSTVMFQHSTHSIRFPS